MLASTIQRCIQTLFKRRGRLIANEESNEAPQVHTLEMRGSSAVVRGERESAGPPPSNVEEHQVEQPGGGLSSNAAGLNLYASAAMVIDGADRRRLERICGCLFRGPLALGRLRQREDGKPAYRLHKPDRRGNTMLVMTPAQLVGPAVQPGASTGSSGTAVLRCACWNAHSGGVGQGQGRPTRTRYLLGR